MTQKPIVHGVGCKTPHACKRHDHQRALKLGIDGMDIGSLRLNISHCVPKLDRRHFNISKI